jgi:RNA polymerase sigma-70 factor (ECF subfamily)
MVVPNDIVTRSAKVAVSSFAMPAVDLDQFERVVLVHLDSAYTLARYLLRDEHDAQDVVQDAALRAMRHFATFRGGDARAWLLTIVRNCCYSQQRKQRRQPRTVALDEAAPAAIATEMADTAVLQAGESARVHQAVAALPDEFREVIVLREIESLSYAEIGAVTGVPIGTVMSRLSRARKRLAALLGGAVKEAS